MAKIIASKQEADSFTDGVLTQAEHHAIGMIGPIKTLYADLINRIDFNRDLIAVYERNGNIARTTWVTLCGVKMVFTYNYSDKSIHLKPSSLRKNSIAQFLWNEPKENTIDRLHSALKELDASC